MNEAKRTPLYEAYRSEEGVRLTDFGGWELPLQFAAGIIGEHHAVRENAGLFDVSHMGEIQLSGAGAESYLNRLVCGDVAKLEQGHCLYTILTLPDGGAVDDLVIYRLGGESFLLVVNAANTDKDFDWIRSSNPDAGTCPATVVIGNRSPEWVQIAYQGPRAEGYLQELAGSDLKEIPFYGFKEKLLIDGVSCLVSRTGYTGEDGFELYCAADQGAGLWRGLLKHGRPKGVLPCGLGARDTLRLEARLPLYGHELKPDAGPLEGGVKSFVDFDKEYFIGSEALREMDRSGSYRILRGCRMVERGVPRQGYPVFFEGDMIGEVTSGGKSPSLDAFIAILRIPRGLVKTGSLVEIEINGKRRRAQIVQTPFRKKTYGGN
jgi:glycine cleavage system T protein (aminomethyltransferase)